MISCEQHDYIEIACTFRLPVRLTFSNAHQLVGIAKDIVYNSDRKECMVISTRDGDVSVVLEELKSIKALEENAHIDIVYFD